MAQIAIGFDALALSKPSEDRKAHNERVRVSKPKSKPKKDVTRRLNKQQFLELSKPQKKRYLENFPKSSHRKLVQPHAKKSEKKVESPKSATNKRTQQKQQDSGKKPEKVSAEIFQQMTPKQQREYRKHYPRPRAFTKKHHVAKKPNIVQQQKKGDMGEKVHDGHENTSELRKQKTVQNKAEKANRNDARRNVRHGVTAETVKSLLSTTKDDFIQAAKNLRANRTQNVEHAFDSLQNAKREVPVDKGYVSSTKAKLRADATAESPELSQKENARASKLLDSMENKSSVSMTSEDRELLDRVNPKQSAEKKSPFWVNDFRTLGKILSGEPVEPQGRGNAMLALTILSRYAMIGAGVAALSLGAAPAALEIAQTLMSEWSDFAVQSSSSASNDLEDVRKIMYASYDAIVDHVENKDHDRMLERVRKGFSEFAKDS